MRVVYFEDYVIEENGILLFRMGFVCLNFLVVRKYFKGFDFIMN